MAMIPVHCVGLSDILSSNTGVFNDVIMCTACVDHYLR